MGGLRITCKQFKVNSLKATAQLSIILKKAFTSALPQYAPLVRIPLCLIFNMPSDVHDARYMYIYLIVINLHSYVNGNY